MELRVWGSETGAVQDASGCCMLGWADPADNSTSISCCGYDARCVPEGACLAMYPLAWSSFQVFVTLGL